MQIVQCAVNSFRKHSVVCQINTTVVFITLHCYLLMNNIFSQHHLIA